MYHHILVPLDGSSFAEHALPMALAIARRTGAAIEVARAHAPAPMLYGDGEFAGAPPDETELREQEQGYLDQVAGRVKEAAGVSVKATRLPGGFVPEALAGHVRAAAADLVVMTTHARSPLGRLLIGSTADQLVRRSNVPLLLVHPSESPVDFAADAPPRRILVPLDGSPLAEEILEPAMALAKSMKADFLLLRILPPAVAVSYPMSAEGVNTFGQAVLKKLEEEEKAARQEAGAYLEGVATRLRSEGLVVRTRVVGHESPADAILEQAQADAADLIAMSTHGRYGIARLFMGSVADKVLRGAAISVLVQRPQKVREGAANQELLADHQSASGRVSVSGGDDPIEDESFDTNPGCFHGQAMR